MISEKTFCERLEVIKAADKQLKDSIESYFEKNNPFIETQEAIAFPAEWIYKLTENHLKTLFAAVNEKIVNKMVIEDWEKAQAEYDAKIEELRKAGMDCFGVPKPERYLTETSIVDDEISYYYAENDFGGEVTKDNITYNLAIPSQLYNYIKDL